jgi:hypothetical protein
MRMLSVSHHKPNKKPFGAPVIHPVSPSSIPPLGKKKETAIVTAWIAELDKLMVGAEILDKSVRSSTIIGIGGLRNSTALKNKRMCPVGLMVYF